MEIATNIAPIALALIMFGLGLGLTVSDFLKVAKSPKDFFIGFVCQVIILPIVAFIIIKIIPVPIELAIGLMIIAAAPGGVTSNILTKFANGDVALSVSLTGIVSLVSVLTVPLIIFTSADLLGVTEINKNISMISIVLKMFFVVTVPVILISLIFILNKYEKLISIILTLFFIFGFIISIYHVGIEQGIFSESLICDIGKSKSTLSTSELLVELKAKVISCKDVTFKVFGISLATLNTIISLCLSVILIRNIIHYE